MFAAACRIIARLVLAAALGVWAFAASAEEPSHSEVVAAQTATQAVAPTRLEAAYSARAGLPLRQFGTELFSHGTDGAAGAVTGVAPVGGVQGDYVLGIGDDLQVVLRSAQRSGTKRYTVDSQGLLVVDEFTPVAAAGRTLAEVREELRAVAHAAMADAEIFLSLVELRRIHVLVVGEVARPGRYAVTSLGTVLDALFAAGGVNPTGSLRRISLTKAGAATATTIDLYDLLRASGHGGDLRLADGDRLVVPTLGPTLAVAGAVRRPAIYELAGESPRLSLADVVGLAGGPLRPGALRAVRLVVGPDGVERPVDINDVDKDKPILGNSDVVLISPRHENRVGEVRLDGHVRRPGPRGLAEQPSVGALVGPDDLLPQPYLHFAALETGAPGGRARTLVPVDLEAVFKLQGDRALRDGDTLIVLGARDIEFLTSRAVLDLLRGRPVPEWAECSGLTVLARALSADPEGPLARGSLARVAAKLTPAEGGCPPVFDRHPDLLLFALTHAALLTRGVPRPGFYPTAASVAVRDLSRDAGGAFGLGGEGRAASGDIVEQTEPWVDLAGPFRHPGVRPLKRARTLRAALGSGRELESGVYPLFGVIDRFDRIGLVRKLIPFSPRAVVAGTVERTLADHDRVVLFLADDLRRLLEAAEAGAARYARSSGLGNGPGPGRGRANAEAPPENQPSAEAPPLTDDVDAPPGPPPPARPLQDAQGLPLSEHDAAFAAFERDAALLTLIRDHAVTVRGAVRRPGGYPVAELGPLTAVIEAAGGPTATADTASVEVTADTPRGPGRTLVDLNGYTGAAALVGPGDAVRVNGRFLALETRGVAVEGEVVRPGSYDVLHGETLSSLLARAGGLTRDAYPAGAVFTRESARRRESEQFQLHAQDIERALVSELFRSDNTTRAEGVAMARQLANTLRGQSGVGRVVVEADPAALKARPELDILLEPGDRLVVPKRSLTVSVFGEVLAPATLQYDPARRAGDYLAQAGGPTRNADEDRLFVLLPNGSSRPLSTSAWNFSDTTIPPGSTIVVPRDPHPFDFLEAARDIGGALGQLALTAASIAVIQRQ